MASCHDMRMDEVYECKECGLQVKVIKECEEVGTPAETCECGPCVIGCCGEELTKKE
jgi:hypothetical protein